MAEVVNVLVAFAVIVFLFRWVTTNNELSSAGSAAQTLGFRPKHITQDMVDRVHETFPDIPIDNIRYDLLRTGNVEVTTNKVIERGFLEAPPQAYYTVFPRTPTTTDTVARPQVPAASTHNNKSSAKKETLISRLHLEERIKAEEPLEINEGQIGRKAVWEDTAAKREASLRKRKEEMVLAARQKMLEKQHAPIVGSSAHA